MSRYAQYRYKGVLISNDKAARIGNLPNASKYLQTYYRESTRGPSLFKTSGFHRPENLLIQAAMEKDRQALEERIQRRAEIEARAQEREIERRAEFEAAQAGVIPIVERPYVPADDAGVFLDLGYGEGPTDADYDDALFDLADQWEVVDIDDKPYPRR